MGIYKANSVNSQNFSLLFDNEKVGDLVYTKWYSFDAKIKMADGREFQLEPKGFWNSKIELKDGTDVLLQFEMGWHGIIIKTFFGNKEETFLLKLKGLLSNQFILLDTDKNELLVAESDFKWTKLNFNYTIETSSEFDSLSDKEIVLLTILHCINYYMAITVAAV